MRLIDVSVLKELVENWFTKNRFYHPYAKNNNIPITELYDILEQMPSVQPEIIRCKDCKHFEYDHIENVNGIPLIVAHEICMRWGEGAKTSENGYCFLAERKDNG